MDIEERLKLVLKKPTEEVLTIDRLREYFEKGIKIQHYIGYEISGYLHLGSLIGAFKIKDFQEARIKTRLFLADWHSFINEKLGGDLDLIRKVAKNYFAKTYLKFLESIGGDSEKLEVVLASEIYNDDYWGLVLRTSKYITLSRAKRSVVIAGRKSSEELKLATLIYVAMQAADIFYQNVNLAHGGVDQRKVHVITIDVGEKVVGYKPVAVHHHIFTSLSLTKEMIELLNKAKRGEVDEETLINIKMSKSKPETALFLHDPPEVIRKKILKGFCPARETKYNPVWELVEWLIFREEPIEFTIVNQKTGEEKTYNYLEDLKKDYELGKIHPLDLKNSVAEYINNLFDKTRKWLLEGPGRKYFEEMKEVRITR